MQLLEDRPAGVDEIKNYLWVKLIFLTGLRLNAKWQQLLPPTLPEKNLFASIASKLHHLQIQGQHPGVRLKLSGSIFIYHKLHHNELVILPQVYLNKARLVNGFPFRRFEWGVRETIGRGDKTERQAVCLLLMSSLSFQNLLSTLFAVLSPGKKHIKRC